MVRLSRLVPAAAALFLGCGLSAAPTAHDMYLCIAVGPSYIVGAKLTGLNGVFERASDGHFQHLGLNFNEIFALDVDPRDSSRIYMATLNGCIQSSDRGRHWRISTSWDATEPHAVRIDPNHPDDVYLALPDGVEFSSDRGAAWTRRENGLPERGKFAWTVQVDRTRAGRVIAGCESGIYLTDNGGLLWRRVFRSSATVDDVEQSPGDPALWIAVTQSDGALLSRDGGITWRKIDRVPSAGALYDASFDATHPRRLAIGSWTYGVLASEDGGRTWITRNAGLPVDTHIMCIAIDPDTGRLYAGMNRGSLYASDDFGRTWRPDGLDQSHIYSIRFVPKPLP